LNIEYHRTTTVLPHYGMFFVFLFFFLGTEYSYWKPLKALPVLP